MLWTYSMKKGFITVSLLPFTEKNRYVQLWRHHDSSDVIANCFSLGLQPISKIIVENFLVLTMNRRRVMRICQPRTKMTPPQTYMGLKIIQAYQGYYYYYYFFLQFCTDLSKRTKSVKAIYVSTFSNSHYALSENEICSNIPEFENTPNLFSCGPPLVHSGL